MKYIYTISLGGLILLMGMFFFVLTLQNNNRYKFKRTAAEMLSELSTHDHFISIEEVRDIHSSLGDYVLIDLRTPDEFLSYHIEGAINIPFERILDKTHAPIFKMGTPKIVYSDDPVNANAAWMVLTQFGYKNISVLNGGTVEWTNQSNTSQDSGEFKDEPGIRDENPYFDYAELMTDKP